MGGASAPPFFRHFPFKNGVLGAHIRKTRCASRKNWVRIQEKLGAHPGKTARRVGKIGRRKVFSKVKDVNVESRKKRSKLLFFGGTPPPFSPWMLMNGLIKSAFILEHESREWVKDEETKSQRDKESKRQRDKKTKSQRDKGTKSGGDKGTKSQREGERKAKKNYGKARKNYGKASSL